MIVREIDTLASTPIKIIGHEYIENVAGLDDALAERVISRPASGQKQVFNIIWDPDKEELVIEISATAEA